MKFKIIFSALMMAVTLVLPYVASADTFPIRSDVYNPTILNGPILLCTGDGAPATVPCTNLCDLVAQAANVIYYAIAFVLWVIAPILIAVGGIMYMLAGGNSSQVQTATKAITGVVVGVVIVLCAYLIVLVFVNFLGITGVGGFGAASCPLG
jgi:hypothetical protein